VPFFTEIYVLSGYETVVQHHLKATGATKKTIETLGELSGLDYQLAPRAQIFRRDQAKVVDLDSFKDLMRENYYTTDPYAKGDPWNAICSRGDLAPSPSPGGCYDGKVTSFSLMQLEALEIQVVNGPTTSNGALPPFDWNRFNSTPHEGMPQLFNFNWETMVPQLEQ
jgi:hypothetical protein